jgi:hypothetical protein
MSFTLRGVLSASVCEDCPISLEGAVVRVYATLPDQGVTARAAADPRHTFRLFHHAGAEDQAALQTAHGALLGEAAIGADGAYSVELGGSYGGDAVDVDLYCGTLNGHVPPRPTQVALTTVQPVWRSVGAAGAADAAGAGDAGDAAARNEVAAFDYAIPPRLTCAILNRLGLWVICGRVTLCGTDQVVEGATVYAFDRDWLQDDALGSAVTGPGGRFQIWYTVADFSKTPFSPLINIELVPGPDLYFRIEGPGGVVLLNEPPSTGRTAGRQNVGPCFCADLCVPETPPVTEPIPDFRYIGGYDYVVDIASGPNGTGRTLADDRAFFLGLRLSGPIGTTLGGQPLEYRFEVRANPDAMTPGPWAPVLPNQILPTMIGTSEKLAGAILEVSSVVVNGTNSPTEIAVTPAVDGWIAMPQEGNLSTGLFTPNLNMIVLDTRTIAGWAPIDVGAIMAGTALPPADLAADQQFGIRLRVRQAGLPLTETDGGECHTLAIDNTLYDHVNKGGSWVPQQVSGQLDVASVNVQELIGSGCGGVTNSLTVLVTAAHPNLGPVSLSMAGGGTTWGFTLPAATPGQIAGAATNNFAVSDLPSCAYIVTLETQVLLTTGDSNPGPVYDQIAFCKR